jgi:hypothetical protein
MEMWAFAKYGRSMTDFGRAIDVPESLLAIRDGSNERSGQLDLNMAINRSVVVLSVAAWQGWVEHFARDIMHMGADAARRRHDADSYGERELAAMYEAVGPLIKDQIQRLNTPNSQNVSRLLAYLASDPRERWTFVHRGKRLTSAAAARELDAWVKVRHAVAHGDPHLPAVHVLDRTRAGHGSLTRRRAEQCVSFFVELVAASTGADYRVYRDDRKDA